MSNINLDLSPEGTSQEQKGSVGGGVIISFIILILVALAYFGIQFQKRMVVSKIEDTKTQYKAQYDILTKGKANDVIDFNNRSAEARELMKKDVQASGVLKKVEETMLAPVFLNSFEYDKTQGRITLECVCGNYNTAAKQVLSFKESGYFSQVIPGDSMIKPEKNELVYKMELILK